MFKDYYFRSPDKESFTIDIFSVLSGADLDTSGKNLVGKTEDGEKFLRRGVVIIEKGDWVVTPATIGEDGDAVSPAETGGHCIANIRTSDKKIQALIQSFSASDPSKNPSNVPDAEKRENGTHRISKPESPLVTFDAPPAPSEE